MFSRKLNYLSTDYELSRFIFTIGFQPVTLQNHELVPLDQDYFMMKASEMNFGKNEDLQLTNIPLENTDEENIGLFHCALTECLFFYRSKLVFGSFHNKILLFDPCPKSFGTEGQAEDTKFIAKAIHN